MAEIKLVAIIGQAPGRAEAFALFKASPRSSGYRWPPRCDARASERARRRKHVCRYSQSWAGDHHDGKGSGQWKADRAMVRITEAGRRVLAAED